MLTAATFTGAGVSASRARLHAEPAAAAMREFGITSAVEARMFLAQALHETGGLVWLVELWGPTAAQLTYAGRLGNANMADAFRFRGRGVFQLTGKANYRAIGRALGIDLVSRPDRAAEPAVAWRIAALYWRTRVRRPGEKMPSFRTATLRINGGYNGWADRVRWHGRLKGRGVVPGPSQSSACRFYRESEELWKGRHTSRQRALDAARRDGVHPRGHLVRSRDEASRLLARRRSQQRKARCG